MTHQKHNLVAQHHLIGMGQKVGAVMFAIGLCVWVAVKGQENLRDARNIVKVTLYTLYILSLSLPSLLWTEGTLTIGRK
jgi:hypothetical protein